MKAITINAAEIWGVADKLGSLDVGKTANVVVANGDPLDVKTDVKQVFIEGRAIPMTSRQTRLRDQYSQIGEPALKVRLGEAAMRLTDLRGTIRILRRSHQPAA